MHKGRLEAFSDGVFAIIITIMVLNLKVPTRPSFAALLDSWPILLGYVLSYVYVGIYWNNHHHLFQAVEHVSGAVLWANLHLLFWLSLIPFLTAWLGSFPTERAPLVCYGATLFFAALSYSLLVKRLLRRHGTDSALAHAIGSDRKGNASLLLYAIGILLALYRPPLAYVCYVVVACMWLVPDRRIEGHLAD